MSMFEGTSQAPLQTDGAIVAWTDLATAATDGHHFGGFSGNIKSKCMLCYNRLLLINLYNFLKI